MNPLNIFSRKNTGSVLGLDIGTTSIKMVEVGHGAKLPKLLNYGMLETRSSVSRANTAFQTSTLKLFDREVGNFLKILIEKMKPHTNQVIVSIPLFSAFTT